MSTSPLSRYPGKDADVVWDERLCIHVGECGRAFGDLFVGGRKPWCQPDLATVAEVVDVVERCPSGALVYEVKDGKTVERPAARNTIAVTYNGPLFARGDLDIVGAPADMPGVRFRAALCRCGQSKRKPFCDNSHDAAGFRDSGAVGQQGDGLKKAEGGKLEIKPQKDGPLQVKGNLTIIAVSGRERWEGVKTWLCRCGQSKDKPFCDGSHKAAGFKAG
ncbi:MAG TPA: CDGSH iron-sulfur domain-containing protein [Burkholderiales bacterium]|nr:CDGSH iron-sulfur domain-containing protein [Burkholderiales bacterium]